MSKNIMENYENIEHCSKSHENIERYSKSHENIERALEFFDRMNISDYSSLSYQNINMEQFQGKTVYNTLCKRKKVVEEKYKQELERLHEEHDIWMKNYEEIMDNYENIFINISTQKANQIFNGWIDRLKKGHRDKAEKHYKKAEEFKKYLEK